MSARQQAVVRDEEHPDEEEPVEPLSKDVVFEILKNQRRRYVLEYLENTSGSVRLGELAEHVAAWENDTEVSKLSSKQRKRVYVGLYQGHLPKMDDAGVVEFNQDRGLIELTDRAVELRQYLDRENDSDQRWSTYYLGFSVLSGSIVGGSIAGLPLVGSIPAVVIAGGAVATLLLLALWHATHEHDLGRLTDRLPRGVSAGDPEQT